MQIDKTRNTALSKIKSNESQMSSSNISMTSSAKRQLIMKSKKPSLTGTVTGLTINANKNEKVSNSNYANFVKEMKSSIRHDKI